MYQLRCEYIFVWVRAMRCLGLPIVSGYFETFNTAFYVVLCFYIKKNRKKTSFSSQCYDHYVPMRFYPSFKQKLPMKSGWYVGSVVTCIFFRHSKSAVLSLSILILDLTLFSLEKKCLSSSNNRAHYSIII